MFSLRHVYARQKASLMGFWGPGKFIPAADIRRRYIALVIVVARC